MNFTKESGLVKVWVSLIMTGVYTEADLPSLYNLKDVVSKVLKEAV